MIAQGEHQTQDFKYEISSVSKIAHSLSAFANADGGRLLVGVRDNGKIAGVHSEEEMYMVDAAATSYCKPEVQLQLETVREEGKMVLIVQVEPCEDRPVLAKEEDGSWRAYVRVADENIVATPVHLALWSQQQADRGVLLPFTEEELKILHLFKDFPEGLTINRFCRKVLLPRRKAIRLLADFVRFELVSMEFKEHQFLFVG